MCYIVKTKTWFHVRSKPETGDFVIAKENDREYAMELVHELNGFRVKK